MTDPKNPNSNVGKWDSWYAGMSDVRNYGDPGTYSLAAEFLTDVDVVEDWGCGGGGFREYCKTGYRGIDGTKNKFVDEVVDLCTYRSHAEGILVRHILEHNFEWKKILENALQSFQKKMCLILFTPFAEQTKQIFFWEELGVPDISFSKQELIDIVTQHGVKYHLFENIPTSSQYKVEHVFLFEKGTEATPR